MFEIFAQEMHVANGVLAVHGHAVVANHGVSSHFGLETVFNGDSFSHLLANFGKVASHVAVKIGHTTPVDTGYKTMISNDDNSFPPPPPR